MVIFQIDPFVSFPFIPFRFNFENFNDDAQMELSATIVVVDVHKLFVVVCYAVGVSIPPLIITTNCVNELQRLPFGVCTTRQQQHTSTHTSAPSTTTMTFCISFFRFSDDSATASMCVGFAESNWNTKQQHQHHCVKTTTTETAMTTTVAAATIIIAISV